MAGHDISDEDWIVARLADVTEDEIDLFMDRVEIGYKSKLSLTNARIAGLEYVNQIRLVI